MAIQDSSRSNKNHAVPQNIMDVEFKIIGDLTLRQFSYVFLFGILAYNTVSNDIGIIKWPLGIFFAIFGLALAFVPIQDRGLDVWIVNFIKSIFKPTQMVWNKSAVLPPVFMYESVNILKQELITLAPTSSRRKLEEYLDYTKKDLNIDPLDIPEEEYISKVRKAYASVKVQPKTIVPSISEITIKQPTIAPTSVLDSKKIDTNLGYTKTIDTKTKYEEKSTENINKISSITYKDTKVSSAQKLETSAVTKVPIPIIKEKEEELSLEKPKKIEEKSISDKDLIVNKEPATLDKDVLPTPESSNYKETFNKIEDELNIDSEPTKDIDVTPLTPDRHSGRVFTSFIPKQGELILPIRGEKVLKTSDQQLDIENTIQDKTKKLQDFIYQIRTNEPSIKNSQSSQYKVASNVINKYQNKDSAELSSEVDSKISNYKSKSDRNKEIRSITDNELQVNSVKNQEQFLKNTSKDTNINSISEKVSKNNNTQTLKNNNIPSSKPIIKNNVHDYINTVRELDNKTKELDKDTSNLVNLDIEHKIKNSKEMLNNLFYKRSVILDKISLIKSNKNYLPAQINDLKKELLLINKQYFELKDIINKTQMSNVNTKNEVQNPKPLKKFVSKNIPLSTKPNILTGILKDNSGEVITNAVLLIKNENMSPIRAIKTNKIGQFILNTPLQNGKYFIQVSPNSSKGLKFDTISVEASGNVIPFIEIVGS